jgi:serine/threonine-protein kinase
VAAAALGVAGFALLLPDSEQPPVRYGLALPASQAPDPFRTVTPSPDGAYLLYAGPVPGERGASQLWLKPRDRYQASPLPGTNGAWNATFSPDGRWIAFIQNGQVKKIAVTGGAPITLGDSAAPMRPGIAWLDNDSIVYIHSGGVALRRVSVAGGTSEVVFRSDTFTLARPSPLPGGRGVLFARCAVTICASTDVWGLDMRNGTARRLVPGAYAAQYVPTGHLVYSRPDGGVFAVAFDPGSLQLRGSPVAVLDSVGEFAVSASGTLAMRGFTNETDATYELVWMDRTGRTSPPLDMDGPLQLDPLRSGSAGWALSPDGRRLAISLGTPAGTDIWVKQLPAGPLTRITFDSVPEARPRWSADGRRVTFVAVGNQSDLLEVSADGTGAPDTIARDSRGILEGAVVPGGWTVVRTRGGLGRQGRDILGFRQGDNTPVELVANPAFDENAFQVSPDGRWMAYESDESGRREVYVRPFPEVGRGKWQASTIGGYAPLWARSGRELFFVDDRRRMTVVSFTPGPEPRFGERRLLFALPSDFYLGENDYYTPFDISPDGQRFLMARRLNQAVVDQAPLIVVDHWFTELRSRMRGQ